MKATCDVTLAAAIEQIFQARGQIDMTHTRPFTSPFPFPETRRSFTLN